MKNTTGNTESNSSPESLRYPIGKFSFHPAAGENEIRAYIENISLLPENLRHALNDLSESELNTPYREGGWTVRQVVHHLADSHINAYVRMKLALTESCPAIKPYKETLWAEMEDAKNMPVEISVTLLDALHRRWTYLLKKLSVSDLEKTFYHPESKREMSVKFLLQLYSWHGKHHCAHIVGIKKKQRMAI